jgi:hypothetical protein
MQTTLAADAHLTEGNKNNNNNSINLLTCLITAE